jgi:hypothetical protein
MSPEEENLVNECIESHRRMIKYHRQQILDLVRQKAREQIRMESFGFRIINESGRLS